MRHLLTLALLALLGACAPEIGDDCSTNQDCGSGRICDLSQPGGYCTVRPCEDTASCPSGSVCIMFENTESYCMLHCEGDDDCRDGYACARDVGPAPFCNAVAAPK